MDRRGFDYYTLLFRNNARTTKKAYLSFIQIIK